MLAKFTHDTEKQDENLAKIVMSAFYKLTQTQQKNGTTSEDIARYLRENFGDVFRTSTLVSKAEQTLARSAALGFLNQMGKRYAVTGVRGACCRQLRKKRLRCGCPKRRRRLRSCRRKRRRSSSRRRRSSSRRRRRRRRGKKCSCS